jgi:two-component system LytT family response regulator
MQQAALRTAIVEDEKLSAILLRKMIEHFCPELQVVLVAQSVQEAINQLPKQEIEVLFLDIRLGDGLGFEVLQQVPNLENMHLVCVTAYAQYAIKAFQENALHYLLKPLRKDELREVVQRIQKLRNPLPQGAEPLQTLSIPTRKDLIQLPIQQILYLQANDNYTYLHLADQTRLLSSKSLSHFEQLLSNNPRFVRIHKSYILNLDTAIKYDRVQHCVQLPNDTQLPVAVRKRAELMKALKQH